MSKEDSSGDSVTRRKILLTVPNEGCDLCGEHAMLLELIGGKQGRTWICHNCKKETEIYLYTTSQGRELLRSIIAKQKGELNEKRLNPVTLEKEVQSEKKS
jgi:hypothetical protein